MDFTVGNVTTFSSSTPAKNIKDCDFDCKDFVIITNADIVAFFKEDKDKESKVIMALFKQKFGFTKMTHLLFHTTCQFIRT